MLLDLKDCSGRLSWKENHIETTFDLSVAKDGFIKLTLIDIPDASWLHELFDKKNRYVEFLQLKGQDTEGNTTTSDSVILNSLRPKPDKKGLRLSPVGSASQFRVDSAKPVTYGNTAELLVEYCLLGFRCFGCLSRKTDLGLIELAGASNIENYDEVSGVFTIKTSPEPSFDLDDRIDRCDKLARSILDILSLANDRYITWASRNIFHNETWVSSLFLGPRNAGEPAEPLFMYSNLQPILNLALTNYSEELKQKTGLGVAIEWFLIKTTYTEVQFLTAMTALEHLVRTYVKQGEIFPKKTFESIIKPQIREALDISLEKMLEGVKVENTVEVMACKKQVEAANEKILEINRYSFKTNLETFLKTYKVPLDGIDWGEIEQLVEVRNKIVHRGLYIPKNIDQYLYDHLAVLRELLKRIFLTLLKFEGEYQSFLNGPEWKRLQPLP